MPWLAESVRTAMKQEAPVDMASSRGGEGGAASTRAPTRASASKLGSPLRDRSAHERRASSSQKESEPRPPLVLGCLEPNDHAIIAVRRRGRVRELPSHVGGYGVPAPRQMPLRDRQ